MQNQGVQRASPAEKNALPEVQTPGAIREQPSGTNGGESEGSKDADGELV
jgi:hypothetical protein